MSWRQAGFDEDVGGVVGVGGTGERRREKKSLMSWASRLREPLEVRREIRPSCSNIMLVQWMCCLTEGVAAIKTHG